MGTPKNCSCRKNHSSQISVLWFHLVEEILYSLDCSNLEEKLKVEESPRPKIYGVLAKLSRIGLANLVSKSSPRTRCLKRRPRSNPLTPRKLQDSTCWLPTAKVTTSTKKGVEIGDQDEAELDIAISKAITRASKHLPNRLKDFFRAMIMDFNDGFRNRLGADAPVHVTPMEIKFEKDCQSSEEHLFAGAARFHEEVKRRVSGSGIHLSQPFLEVDMCSSHCVQGRAWEISLNCRSPSSQRSKQEACVTYASCWSDADQSHRS